MKISLTPFPINWVVGAHIGSSVAAAFLAPLLMGSMSSPEFLLSVPTVETLSIQSRIENLWAYFLVMYSLLPVVICVLAYSYKGKAPESVGQAKFYGALIFFLAAMALLAWFAFLLPPDREYRGTRIRILIYAASNYHIWLGLIFGVIFACLALLSMLFAKYAWWLLRNNMSVDV